MPVAPDFRLYHSNALDVLAGLLAQELRAAAAPEQALLAPDVVLIPQVAMRRWLQATLAQAHGIAANLEFLTPGEFVQRALDANVPGKSEDIDAEALRWRLYAALSEPELMREAALRPLRTYLEGDEAQGDDALKPWSLAGELASVFEKYQAWRRDWLLGWEAGRGKLDPQAALWRRVAGGRAHRARRIEDYLQRLTGDDPDAPLPVGLPSRLFAFATLNVSPDVLRVIASQARVGTLHFYMPTPTRKYWGDLATLAERLRDDDAAAFAEGSDENPLLQHWGAAGRDFMAVLGGYEVVHPSGEIAAYADPEDEAGDAPERDSLLQRLQRDLLHRRAPSAWREEVDLDDPSLQIHACHTRLREVQVLHDRLRGLLEDPRFDPPLEPRDIAVLAPDIDPYAPYIQAVFGGLAGRPEFIPYALADASPLVAEPLAEVFLRLLALPVSRFGLGEVLDLLATPTIAQHAGLEPSALDRLRHWLQEAGARWGLDAAHRTRHAAPADDAYTWAFALDRLLLGHASGSDQDIAGVAPWTALEGTSLHALDALIRVLRVLARHERAFATALTPMQWHERILALLHALLPATPHSAADQRTLERLRTALDNFARSAARAEFDAPVPPEVVRAHFQSVLADADTRAPLLTGGVSFGRMVPMRLLPFRAICVLGMNDGDYPRRDPAGGLNQLTAELGTSARRPGDRSLREDDRFLFLQLFAASADVFYVSCLGADPRDGSQREPSLLVTELIDAASRYHADPDAAREGLVLRHPLQPFAPAAFGAAAGFSTNDPRRYSYRGEWHDAAAAGSAARKSLGRWITDPLEAAPVEESLTLAQLRGFLRDPADAFLRQRLAMRLPEAADAIDDGDPLAPPPRGLQRWQMQQAVFEACVMGQHDSLHARLRARALLPSGPLGERVLAGLLSEVQPYAENFVQWRGDEQVRPEPFELEIDGVHLHGSIDQSYRHGLPRFRYEKLHGPAQITHGLDWLVLCALGRKVPLIQFCDTGSGPGTLQREPIDAEPALAALSALLRLRAWGLRDPLPFAPRAGWLWYEGQRRLDAGEVPRANSKSPWERAQDQWRPDSGFGEGTTASTGVALRGRDPFGSSQADLELGEEFRRIASIVFDAVVHGRDTEAA
ncbi:MAG: exodeoxyribonuclease V subunit gamma [Pseudomonadota bacterium]|nr:exodeoxyribonuclease V subunit gamma [Pseudomonadota bacterium]